jgi:hypothetical protein
MCVERGETHQRYLASTSHPAPRSHLRAYTARSCELCKPLHGLCTGSAGSPQESPIKSNRSLHAKYKHVPTIYRWAPAAESTILAAARLSSSPLRRWLPGPSGGAAPYVTQPTLSHPASIGARSTQVRRRERRASGGSASSGWVRYFVPVERRGAMQARPDSVVTPLPWHFGSIRGGGDRRGLRRWRQGDETLGSRASPW